MFYLGNGVVLHIPTLLKEIESNEENGLKNVKERIKISNRTQIGTIFSTASEILMK